MADEVTRSYHDLLTETQNVVKLTQKFDELTGKSKVALETLLKFLKANKDKPKEAPEKALILAEKARQHCKVRLELEKKIKRAELALWDAKKAFETARKKEAQGAR